MDGPASTAARFRLDRKRSSGTRGPHVLVHGDHRHALPWFAKTFDGRVKLAYLDPPFNTGRAFREYSDTTDEWADEFSRCLEGTVPLLREDATVVIHIDEHELVNALSVADRVLGRKNRASIVTLVRSAATGHKARNRGVVNVADYLLVYAANRKAWRPNMLTQTRSEYDWAYGTAIENIDAAPSKWQFVTLRAYFGALPRDELAARAIANAERIIRFAQPRFDAVGKRTQEWILRSQKNPTRVYRLERPGYSDMWLRGGNRILFLRDKITERGGKRVLVEPLTNVWTDIPFQGIAREGGVRFERNKKPERLMARLLEWVTSAGDIVLDPYLGSGTTAAVCMKMGRVVYGIERGAHFDSLIAPRLVRTLSEVGDLRTDGFSVYEEQSGT